MCKGVVKTEDDSNSDDKSVAPMVGIHSIKDFQDVIPSFLDSGKEDSGDYQLIGIIED